MKKLPDQLHSLANSLDELIEAVEMIVPVIEKASTSIKKASNPKPKQEKNYDSIPPLYRNTQGDDQKKSPLENKDIQEILNNPLVKNIFNNIKQK